MLCEVRRQIPWLTLSAVLLTTGCRQKADFQSDVQSAAKPWTHLDFQNDPGNFQFAIVTDRTGGSRAGIFESAVGKLNLLQPEFVITVGDMIEGYTDDATVLSNQWSEFTGFVSKLDMPFFFLPGNHDNLSPVMRQQYLERFGQAYYAFVYRNVLFMTLDTQEVDPGLSAEQVAWAEATLRAHPDVRWTLVFMHQPLWIYEEGNLRTARKVVTAGKRTGFAEIQKALGNRQYTVLAGHFHQYAKFERQMRNYYVLGTTGGQSQLRGPGFGEFDHAVWVTMTTNGPILANLTLDGILPDDVHTEAHLHFESGLAFLEPETLNVIKGATLELPVVNPFGHRLHADIAWDLPADGSWTITPATTTTDVPSLQTNVIAFALRYTGDAWLPSPPRCTLRATAGSLYMPEEPLPIGFPIDPFLREFRPTTVAARLNEPVVVDGALGDAGWPHEPTIADFRRSRAGQPPVETLAWLAYDDAGLVVALRCSETNMSALRTTVTNRDDMVWVDDSVEVFLGTGDGGYRHWAINAAGILYDGAGTNGAAFNGAARAAAGREESGWTAELAIPWEDIGGKPEGRRISLALARGRPSDSSVQQYPPLNGGNHRHDMHGWLELAP